LENKKTTKTNIDDVHRHLKANNGYDEVKHHHDHTCRVKLDWSTCCQVIRVIGQKHALHSFQGQLLMEKQIFLFFVENEPVK